MVQFSLKSYNSRVLVILKGKTMAFCAFVLSRGGGGTSWWVDPFLYSKDGKLTLTLDTLMAD